ncbi:MAG: hypothetical protein JXR15_02480 [Shimia sp.]|uniref:hypothetical protein n=1 Tax=Shimia sp. TaxID=1954381 RepID=UPI003B8B47F6
MQYLPAILAVVFCLTVTPVLAIVSAPVKTGGPVLIVARPGTDLTELVEGSGGWVVGVARAPLAVMGVSDDDGFEQRLKRNGAWAILDGEALSWLCGDAK